MMLPLVYSRVVVDEDDDGGGKQEHAVDADGLSCCLMLFLMVPNHLFIFSK